MNQAEQRKALATAVKAAHAAGSLMRANFRSPKKIHLATQHDIKLELDVRCQKRIEAELGKAFPRIPLLGEEGVSGNQEADQRWVVDPIDGTVNFTYGIPHACVSIALQARRPANPRRPPPHPDLAFETVVGVVFDPFTDELWTARRGEPARLNGRPIRVSARKKLAEAVVSIGFAKETETLEKMLPLLNQLMHRVRKIRMMGAAALAMTYVAGGRFDAYAEYGIRLWDIAAGGLILECAGGEFWHEPVSGEHTFRVIASNGNLRRQLQQLV